MSDKVALFLSFALFGCAQKGIDLHTVSNRPACITEAERTKLAAFIVACARAANPMSDEEGEDLVRQCEWTGKSVVCPDVRHCWNNDANNWELCK